MSAIVIGLASGLIGLGSWSVGPAFSEELTPPPLHATQPARHPVIATPKPIEHDKASPRALSNQPVERRGTPSLAHTLNILLVGIDRKPGQKYGGRPDTIVVAALDEKSGHLGLVSVPRDLYVDIPEHGKDRINATFAVAWNRKGSALDLLERVIEDTLKLPIEHRIAVDLSGFETLIDSLGGVDVRIPCPIVDNFIDTRTASGRRLLDLDAGIQRLTGQQAALYVRSRHGRSDWSRARRQQAVLFGIKARFSAIEGLSRFPDFYDSLQDSVASDMSRAELFQLALPLSNLAPERIHGLVLGAKEAAPHYTEEGKAVLLPNYEAIDQALGTLFSRSLPGTRPAAAACPPAKIALKKRRGRVNLVDESHQQESDAGQHSDESALHPHGADAQRIDERTADAQREAPSSLP